MKLLNFPNFEQTFKYDCGATAMQAVLAYYGIEAIAGVIPAIAKTSKRYGTSLEGFEKVAKKFGLKTSARRMTINDLKRYIDKKIPVIVLMQSWPRKRPKNWEENWKDSHYVVAIGYDSKNIYFEDPLSIFRTYLPYQEFLDRWHGMNGEKRRYIHAGVAVYGKEGECDLNKFVPLE